MSDMNEKYIDSLVGFFEQGIKKTPSKALGLEAEHFILYQENDQAVSYYGENGVCEILKKLMKRFPDAEEIRGEDLLGFSTAAFTVTLEPAAQFEISVVPAERIECIGTVYCDFLNQLNEVLSPLSMKICHYGTQPASRVRDLPLIPKERYRLMDRYFETTGGGGIEMMRGTCSVQVSIDFFSEEDFRHKIRAAYYYTPLFKLLTDNSRMFEGKPVSGFLKRTDIWNRTDAARCGILPGIFKEDYSFADYARFLADMPLIFTEQGGICTYTGAVPSKEIYRDRLPSEEEIIHILSMAFPEVRLKHFLEIRAADSMPFVCVTAYCALVKGLMYSEEGLSFAGEQIRDGALSGNDVKTTLDDLMKRGWQGELYGRPAKEEAVRILDLAGRGLSEEEQPLLGAFYSAIEHEGIGTLK